MSYVYIESENWKDEAGIRHRLYTVGFYTPGGEFKSESDWSTTTAAASRVNFLNGGQDMRWADLL